MSKESHQEWTIKPWTDGAGKLTNSFDIWEGDTLIVVDQTFEDASTLRDAHNAALAAERSKRKPLVDAIRFVRMECGDAGKRKIDDALAKVKEGK
jgi:hypothetical protein